MKQLTLASGKQSDHYFDIRKTSLDPEGGFLIATIFYNFLESIKDQNIDSVGGLGIGTSPLIGTLAYLNHIDKKLVNRFFIVRNEEKKHGMKNKVEGNIEKGDRIVLIEDVLTTGGSILKAASTVEKCGCEVVSVFSVLDREEEKTEGFDKYKTLSIFKSSNFNLPKKRSKKKKSEKKEPE
jgi:orotate phosphoribosyltransferase